MWLLVACNYHGTNAQLNWIFPWNDLLKLLLVEGREVREKARTIYGVPMLKVPKGENGHQQMTLRTSVFLVQ